MKTAPWTTYRTRFLVKAKPLHSNLSFIDALGRLHSGRKGDYLVESADGVLCIHPKRIFEDIYVAMGMAEAMEDGQEQRDFQNNGMPEPQVAPQRRKLPQRSPGRRALTTGLGWV